LPTEERPAGRDNGRPKRNKPSQKGRSKTKTYGHARCDTTERALTITCLEGRPMATNKVKRSFPAAQPRRRRPHPITSPETITPVKAHIYKTIGELNGGFEEVLQDLSTLGRISLFRANSLTATHSLVSKIRAQVNRELSQTLHEDYSSLSPCFPAACRSHNQPPGCAGL
jgi:hypothetical protein